MTTQPSNNQTQSTRFNDDKINAVVGGKHRGFHFETMNGRIYAIGHINGSTVAVRVG